MIPFNPSNYPAGMDGRARLVPVEGQKDRVRSPAEETAERVHLLAVNKALRVEKSARHLTLTIPSVLVPEMAAIDS